MPDTLGKDILVDKDRLLFFLEQTKKVYSPKEHTHSTTEITGFPTSMKNPHPLKISLNGVNQDPYDGSSEKTIAISWSNIGAAPSSHGTHVSYGTINPLPGGTASPGVSSSVSRADHVHPLQTSVPGGSEYTTKLKTARSINGSLFDGTKDIVTPKWGSARRLTIGNSTKGIDGSGDVSFSLTEMGAATMVHSHQYIPLDGGTMTGGQIIRQGISSSWYNGRNMAILRQSTSIGYNPIASVKTSNGSWEIGTYDGDGNTLNFVYITDSDFNSKNNTCVRVKIDTSGEIYEGNVKLSSKYALASHGNHPTAGSIPTYNVLDGVHKTGKDAISGTAATFARSDHVHKLPYFLKAYETNKVLRFCQGGQYIFVADDYSIPTKGLGVTEDVALGWVGSSTYHSWKKIFTESAVSVQSDEDFKDLIEIDERYEKMFMDLHPTLYKYKNFTSTDEHDRIHCGFGAQSVEKAANKHGLTTMDVAAIIKSMPNPKKPVKDKTESYMLAYEEFIALNTHMIQKLYKENKELRSENNALKDRLTIIEEKLGIVS